MPKAGQYQRLAAWFEQHVRHLERLTHCRTGSEDASAYVREAELTMHWEVLARQQPSFDLRRAGRFLVADLTEPHRVLSTSVRHGGQVDHVRHLLNHQSCEGTAHHERHRVMTEAGLDAYHDRVCAEVGAAGRIRPR